SAVDAAPRILDQRRDRLTRADLGTDADDLDTGDAMALVRRVVAFAAAEVVEPRRPERARRPLGTAGLLLEGADGAHAEDGGLRGAHLGAHRHRAVRAVDFEPEED